MKKLLFKIILIIILLIFLWAGFNLLTDISEPVYLAGEGYDTSNIIRFLDDLFPPVKVTRDNGFFHLWTLVEPPDADPDEMFRIQQDLNDPEKTTEKSIRDWEENIWSKRKDQYYKQLKEQRWTILNESSPWDIYPQSANKDWGQILLKQKADVLKMEKLMKPLLDRYDKLIDLDYFEDYTLIVIEKGKINFTAPIPNLLAWIHTAKQYVAKRVLDALEGDWEASVSRITDHLEFAKRANRGSRTLITNLISKAVLKISLFGIASVMNQPDCPEAVYQMVLDRLDELEFDEYGTRKQLMAEGSTITQLKSIIPFFQANRTKQYYYEHLSTVVEYESIPPYKWEKNPKDRRKVKNGFFWWLQNPLGKLNFEDNVLGNFATIVLKSVHSKTLYDMVRISAELHLKYDPEKSVQENLNSLGLYKSLMDPCSGKPYIWHEKKQMLYSIGADRDDDGGKDGPLTSWDADFFLPVHLYVK